MQKHIWIYIQKCLNNKYSEACVIRSRIGFNFATL